MVKGSATVRVDGICRVLGMDVSGKTVHVRSGRILPFEPATDCILEVLGGEIWDAEPYGAGTAMWTGLVKRILGTNRRRIVVMILGATDTGKSTLSTYIANVAVERGLYPCIIDGDIGQGDLAPPTAIGATLIHDQMVDLRDAAAEYYEFVGSVTPASSERLVACRMKSMLRRTRHLSNMHIINTDGYIADGGEAYKRMLTRALAPDVVVFLGRRSSAPSLSGGSWRFLYARSSVQGAKTHSDRIGRRMDQFMRHLGEGVASLRADSVQFIYKAKPVSHSRIVHLFTQPSIEGMFVGLGQLGTVTGFGTIEGLDEEVRIRTGVKYFDTVYLSNIALRGGMEIRLD